MPKPMMRQPQTKAQQTNTLLSAVPRQDQKQKTQQMTQMQMDRLLRKPRSKKYMDAMHRLDAGGHTMNQHKVDSIIDAIREEFPEVELQGVLLGVISKCYLGDPYEVHTLDLIGDIIEHYKRGQTLPNNMEKARTLAIRGGYDFIEVYVDCCRAISSNGTVAVIK